MAVVTLIYNPSTGGGGAETGRSDPEEPASLA